jgi:endonuclease/exonuclease/phosphatase family metal-dependent hydrolase
MPAANLTSALFKSQAALFLQLREAHQENQGPQNHFCKDLQFLLQDRINSGHEIILMGDFNEELGSLTREFTKRVTECNLVNVYAAVHGLEEEVPAYARGQKCLDYFLMTLSVASHVICTGAEPFNHRFFWDHGGIFVDLELKGLFDCNLAPLAGPTF